MSHPVLRLQLLGAFSLTYGGAPITGVNSARLQSLLTALILHANAPQARQHLAFLLWPDTTESQARNNLRQFLYQLRQALPDTDRFLKVDASTVCWKLDAEQLIDVFRFGHALNEAEVAEQRGDVQACCHSLEQAVSCYEGDLLPGCYEDWILPERERLRRQYGQACQRLLQILEAQREYAEALQVAQRLQRLDPLDEGAYVSLIRLCGLNDDRTGAHRMYQIAAETLQRELGMEPGEALQAAYRRSQRTLRSLSLNDDDVSSSSHTLVGRQREWQQLQASWHRAAEGGAHLCLITGEAGIGKSRLAEELFRWGARQGFTTAYTRSYGMEGSLSLSPVTEWLRSKALHPHLASLDPVWLTEIARLLPELLSENTNLSRPEPITEYGRRQPFFEALARGVLAAPQPLLLWIDDLHWCDQETLEWLHFMLRFKPRMPVLLLGTARSEESTPDHPLSALARQLRIDDRVVSIELSPLDGAETARLASQVQGHSLDDVANVRLYRETEGNPLFVVETVRAGLPPAVPSRMDGEVATISPETSSLPPRVQAIIAGRLAQLSPSARSVAEIGAAVGRAFTLEMLLLAGRENEETVIDALQELWVRRIVREQGANVFDFTHDKLREVTYAETSQPQRRLLHRRIAQAFETLHEEDLDPISVQIAAHFEQAGLLDQAIPYYQRAGAVAAGVYANDEAIRLLSHGLKLLGQVPAARTRDTQELNIQLALATMYRISKGWASAEEERVMNRVMVLSEKVGDVEQRLRSLFGLQAFYVVQAQYGKVDSAYDQMQQLFKRAQITPPPFAELYRAGASLFTGRIAEARELFTRVVADRHDDHVRGLQESHGLNYVVHGLAWNSHAIWCLGYSQQAMNNAQMAVDFARECKQPFNQALAISYLAMLQMWQADTDTFLACAEEACTLAKEHKAPYYHAYAQILQCFARAVQRPIADHLSDLQAAIHHFTETGARARLPVYYSLLAEASLKAGRPGDGMDALEQAFAYSLQNDEHWWDAELHRLRGELLWAQGADPGEIEAAFLRALETARIQQARSLELRAATSLARLWQGGSRAADAKQCLTEVYGWFTEGFDTLDLRNAHALVAQL